MQKPYPNYDQYSENHTLWSRRYLDSPYKRPGIRTEVIVKRSAEEGAALEDVEKSKDLKPVQISVPIPLVKVKRVPEFLQYCSIPFNGPNLVIGPSDPTISANTIK